MAHICVHYIKYLFTLSVTLFNTHILLLTSHINSYNSLNHLNELYHKCLMLWVYRVVEDGYSLYICIMCVCIVSHTLGQPSAIVYWSDSS